MGATSSCSLTPRRGPGGGKSLLTKRLLRAVATFTVLVQALLPSSVHHVHAQDPRVRNLTLSMGCPEFLSTFYEANVSSTVPYRSFSITKGTGYAYVQLHFPKLWLPPGSSVVVRGVENVDVKDTLLNLTESFASGELWEDVVTAPVLAKELHIEFYREVGAALAGGTRSAITTAGGGGLAMPGLMDTAGFGSTAGMALGLGLGLSQDAVNDRHCYGFVVDRYAYELVDVARNITPSNEATCANDNSKEAFCYYEDAATRSAYLAARSVARLLIQKEDGTASACTGWLLGSEGHLITNYHCVNSQAQASATTVEFMADATACNQDCTGWGDCAGTVEAISTTLVRANEALDYALLKLQSNKNLPKKYGFLRLKATKGRVGQEIYIPQHPLFHGKRIAMVNDFGTKTAILSIDAQGCNTTGYSYNGDTQGGSSGSPVIDAQDHGVVALHHCGQFCGNTGIPSVEILADMGAAQVVPASAVDPGDNQNLGNFPPFQPREEAPPRVLNPVETFSGAIVSSAVDNYKGNKDVQVSVDQFEFTLVNDAEISIDVLSAEISNDGLFKDLNGDCKATYLDAVLFLFRQGDDKAVIVNDDAASGKGIADGSISSRDPFIQTFLKAGTYVVALGAMPLKSKDALSGVALQKDAPEIYSCVKMAQVGSYRIQFQSSDAMAFNRARLPPAVDTQAPCAVPPGAICAF